MTLEQLRAYLEATPELFEGWTLEQLETGWYRLITPEWVVEYPTLEKVETEVKHRGEGESVEEAARRLYEEASGGEWPPIRPKESATDPDTIDTDAMLAWIQEARRQREAEAEDRETKGEKAMRPERWTDPDTGLTWVRRSPGGAWEQEKEESPGLEQPKFWTDGDTGLTWVRTTPEGEWQLAPKANIARTFEEAILQALLEGSDESIAKAIELDEFNNRMTERERLDFALRIAQSPGDYVTYWNLMRSEEANRPFEAGKRQIPLSPGLAGMLPQRGGGRAAPEGPPVSPFEGGPRELQDFLGGLQGEMSKPPLQDAQERLQALNDQLSQWDQQGGSEEGAQAIIDQIEEQRRTLEQLQAGPGLIGEEAFARGGRNVPTGAPPFGAAVSIPGMTPEDIARANIEAAAPFQGQGPFTGRPLEVPREVMDTQRRAFLRAKYGPELGEFFRPMSAVDINKWLTENVGSPSAAAARRRFREMGGGVGQLTASPTQLTTPWSLLPQRRGALGKAPIPAQPFSPQGLLPLQNTVGLPAFGATQLIKPARLLPSLGAPTFPSLQGFRQMLPSERAGLMGSVAQGGFPTGDYLEQMERQWPVGGRRGLLRLLPRRAAA